MSIGGQAGLPGAKESGRGGPPRSLWLLPAIFLVHDGEEVLTMPGWVAAHRPELERLAGAGEAAAGVLSSLPTTTAQAATSAGLLLLLFAAVTAGAHRAGGRGPWLYAYAALLGVFFLHTFTHLAQAPLFGGYTPGVVSAVLAVVPGALYIYRKLFEGRLLTLKSAALCALAGFALFVPGALLAHRLGRLLAGG